MGISLSLNPSLSTSTSLNQTDLRSANYIRCKVKLNTSPLKSIGLPCSSLI